MSLFKEFQHLYPYIQSVRKLKTYLSFDIEFPLTWKILKRHVNDKNVIENESLNSETRHFSFVCEFTEGAVDDIIKSITDIIQYNKDKEEKERLFNSKVEELKNIFEKQRLDNLQNLTFLFESNNKRIELGDDEEDADTTGEPSGLVEK
jgi:hypothetical protein